MSLGEEYTRQQKMATPLGQRARFIDLAAHSMDNTHNGVIVDPWQDSKSYMRSQSLAQFPDVRRRHMRAGFILR